MGNKYEGYQYLRVEKKDKVALVTLNRPEQRNAITAEVHGELEKIFQELDLDEEVRAVVLTGAGRAFSAGGDVRWMLERAEAKGFTPFYHWRRRAAEDLIQNILNLRVPYIAAVNGPAVGLGATIALFADTIIASEKARFSDPHVRVGLAAGDGGAIIWPLLVGVAKAKEMLMTGDSIDAREAERIGLINRVVTEEELIPTAMALASRLANGPAIAISWTKMAVNKMIKHFVNLILDTSLAWEHHTQSSEDHLEAAKAFTEKREPIFKAK